jgi:tetratricopeptide (TPR) repeat protein
MRVSELDKWLDRQAVRQLAGVVKEGMESHIRALESQDARLYEAVFTLREARDYLASLDYSTATGLADLKAAFDYGMSQAVWQLERSQEALVGIVRALEEPLDTQARELRKRAQNAYRNGLAAAGETRGKWMDDALADYLEAARRNRYDFTLHFDIASILWHEKGELADAARYYQEAARYAAPTSAYYASYALLHLGRVRRLRAELEPAYAAAREAVRLSPELAQACYDLALYCALTRRYEECVGALRRAVEADELYWVHAINDMQNGDLRPAREQVAKLQELLRDEQREVARKGLSDARCEIEVARLALAETWSGAEFANAVGVYERSRRLFAENSRFSLLSAATVVHQAAALAQAAGERAEATRRAREAAAATIAGAEEAIAVARSCQAERHCPGEIAFSYERLRSARLLYSRDAREDYEEARKQAHWGLDAAHRAAQVAQEMGKREADVTKRKARLGQGIVFAAVLAALGLMARYALIPRYYPEFFAQGAGPLWAPDGRSIAYFTGVKGGLRLMIASVDGARALEVPLGDGEPSRYSCEWSPDGREIAVFDHQPGGWESQETRVRVYSCPDGRLVLEVPRSGPYDRLAEEQYGRLPVPEWLQRFARQGSGGARPRDGGLAPSAGGTTEPPELTDLHAVDTILGPYREGCYFTHPSSDRQQRAGGREVYVVGEGVYLREGRREARIAEGRDPRLSPDGRMVVLEDRGGIYIVSLDRGM